MPFIITWYPYYFNGKNRFKWMVGFFFSPKRQVIQSLLYRRGRISGALWIMESARPGNWVKDHIQFGCRWEKFLKHHCWCCQHRSQSLTLFTKRPAEPTASNFKVIKMRLWDLTVFILPRLDWTWLVLF